MYDNAAFDRPQQNSPSPLLVPSAHKLAYIAILVDRIVATPKREGKSWFTEAWELPPPRDRQLDDTPAGAGDGEDGRGGGAYVGLFRPPDANGRKSELGFHMCAAVIPIGGGDGAGAVAEEVLDQPRQRHHPERPRGTEVWNIYFPYTICTSTVSLCARHAFGSGQISHRLERITFSVVEIVRFACFFSLRRSRFLEKKCTIGALQQQRH